MKKEACAEMYRTAILSFPDGNFLADTLMGALMPWRSGASNVPQTGFQVRREAHVYWDIEKNHRCGEVVGYESNGLLMRARIPSVLGALFVTMARLLHNLLSPFMVIALFLSGCSGEQGTHPAGEVLYRRYCASCHGTEGKGDGPLAASLRRPPTDLTTLGRRTGGRFDEAAVMAVIDGRRFVAEHGPREMPVWGVVFEEELKDQSYTQYTGLLRSRVLADYLRSIQQE